MPASIRDATQSRTVLAVPGWLQAFAALRVPAVTIRPGAAYYSGVVGGATG
ncbi:MAG TPA: hypothetical protein VN327_01770 [Pseudonocardiaceae bacterium]|nr:hypothetical protein [Pseudonocardiaceae bacterium]